MRVRVSGVQFSAAHFIKGEPLHGHNYRLDCEVEAREKEGIVIDFRELRGTMREACAELDHRFILPAKSPHLRIQKTKREITIIAGTKRYVLPLEDVAFLPIAHATAEELARYLHGKISKKIRGSISVALWESDGARAVFAETSR